MLGGELVSTSLNHNHLVKLPDEYAGQDLTKLSDRHMAFCEAYASSFSNVQACAEVGYSDRQGRNLLRRADINAYLRFLADNRRTSEVMSSNEVLTRLSAVARGDVKEEVVLQSGQLVLKGSSHRDTIRALELLGQTYGLYKQVVDVNKDTVITVSFEDDEDDIVEGEFEEVEDGLE